MNAARLYLRYIAVSIRGQMQYPAAFLMQSFGNFFTNVLELVGIWALFDRFDDLQGWTFGQVALFYGAVSIAFAIADAVSRGFDVFGPQFVKTGNFDRLLLRPRSTAVQLLGYELRLSRIGRFLQGAVALFVAIHVGAVDWTPVNIALFLWSIVGGIALFMGVMLLQATLAFWTVENLEVANILSYGSVQAAQYPITVYADWLKRFLIFVVPIGCVSYFPLAYLLGVGSISAVLAWTAPLAGFAFCAVMMIGWRIGVGYYTSTGS